MCCVHWSWESEPMCTRRSVPAWCTRTCGRRAGEPGTQAQSPGFTMTSSGSPLMTSFPGPQGVTTQPGGGDSVQLLAKGSDIAQTHSRPQREHSWVQTWVLTGPPLSRLAHAPLSVPQLPLQACFCTWQGSGLDPGARCVSCPQGAEPAHRQMLQTPLASIPKCIPPVTLG